MIISCKSCEQKNRVSARNLTGIVRCGKCKADLAPFNQPIDADVETFDEVLRDADVPVLVDFWAAWCGPCRMAAPEVAKVASEMAGRALVLKIDTDRYPELGARYGVRGIPNFVVLRGGQQVFQQSGVVPHTEMRKWLERAG